MKHIRHIDSGHSAYETSGDQSLTGESGSKRTILIVEDDPFIAMDMEYAFEEAGYVVVGPVEDVASALKALAENDVDLACLDYNLGNETSMPIAEILGEKNIPFVFATGHPGAIADDLGIEANRVLAKPVEPRTVLQALVNENRV